MKIFLINSFYNPYILGGAERSVQILAEALRQNGDTPIVITANPGKGIKCGYINRVKVYYIHIVNLYSLFTKNGFINPLLPFWHIIDTYNHWTAKKLHQIVTIESPDIIHTHNLAGFSVSAWSMVKRRNIPLVHTIRDYYLLCPRSTMFQNGNNCDKQCWYCRGYSFLKKIMSKHVDAVVGISSHILNRHLSQGYFKNCTKKTVIYNSYRNKSDLQTRKSKGEIPLRIGYLGQLKPAKGIELLLQVASALPPTDYDFRIGGRGPDKFVKYLKQISYTKNKTFLGFVEPDAFYPDIDLLIVPSIWHEPLGRTVLEAYSYGIPVIASNRGGLPEIIDVGKTGYIFDPDYPGELLNILKRLRSNPENLRYMSKNAKKKSKDFLPEKSMLEYRDIYLDLLGVIAS